MFKKLEFKNLNLFRISNFEFRILPFVLVTGYALLVTASIASAAGIVPCGTEEDASGNITNPCNICYLFQGTSDVISFLLEKIAFPLGIVAILYGGFKIMTAAGSEEDVKKGKTALNYAVIGLVIAFAGWLIIDTILKNLVTDNTVWPFSDTSWNTICSQ